MTFLIENQTGAVYLNEINTIPGSLAGYLYEDRGISLKEVLNIVIDDAIKQDGDRKVASYSSKSFAILF